MEVKEFELFNTGDTLLTIVLDSGDLLFHATEACIYSERVKDQKNVSRWVKNNLNENWYTEFKTDSLGRPGLYITLPGFLYMVAMGKTEACILFRKKVFEDILPSIIKDGYYFDKPKLAENGKYEKMIEEATGMKDEIDHLRFQLKETKERNEFLEQDNRYLNSSLHESKRQQLILQYIHDLKWNICGFYQIAQSTKAKVKLIDVYPKFKQIVNDLSPKDVEEVVNSVLDILWESEGKPSVHPKFYFEDPLNDGFPTIYQIKRVTDTKELRRRQKLIDDGCL